MSTPVTTRTGRRVVLTQAAAAAAESKGTAGTSTPSGGSGGGTAAATTSTKSDAGSGNNATAIAGGGAAARKSARASTRTTNTKVEEKEKAKESPKPKEVAQTRVATRKETRASTAATPAATPTASATPAEAPKRRGGLRNTRQSSGSAEESAEDAPGSSPSTPSGPPAKKAKAAPPETTATKGKVGTEKKKTGDLKEATPSSSAKVEPVANKRASASPAKVVESKVVTPEGEHESETDEPQAMSVDEHGTPVMAAANADTMSMDDENDHSDLLIQKVVGQPGAEPSTSVVTTEIIHVEADNRSAADLIEAQMALLHHSGGNLEDQINQQQQQQITVLSGQQHQDIAAAVQSVISLGTVAQLSADGNTVVVGVPEAEGHETVKDGEEPGGMENPPWNEQGCIVCNIDLSVDDMTNPAGKNHEKMKEFFLEFFSVGDQISLDDESTFPFCQKCAEDLESLMGINHKIEFMHKQFNKVRDSLAKKAIKTFLVRTKPNCLEEDVKAESYGYMEEEHKKPYKEQMFNLWRSRYELVQPGPKTPVMIRSMDSRGRVTVVRLNSQGQPIPDKFGSLKRFSGADMPIPGLGRLIQSNGGDDDGEGGNSIDIYKCNECPKSFNTKIMLAYHSRIHTGELPFECELCGKAFSVPHYLMTHMRSHTGEKPYKCEECGKGFAQRGGLVTHALVHTGAKPYSCEICGKSFRQKYHLTQHMLIHSGVKPFKCDLCGKDFNVKMNLREHMRRHTGDRPYKCPYCTTIGFFRKKMLKEHIVKAHPQRPMPVELMGESDSTLTSSSAAAADSNDSSQSAEEGHEEVNEDEMDEEEEEIMDTEVEEAEAMPTAKIEADG